MQASGTEAARSAGRSRRAWTVLLVVSAIGLVADLGTKALAFGRIAGHAVSVDRAEVLRTADLGSLIPAHRPVVVIPGVLELTLVLNSGAVFGIGSGARWFFIVFTIAALAFVVWAFALHTRARDTLAHVSAGLLVAGGLGNLYDRLLFACVRDFLHPFPGVGMPFASGRPLWPYVSNVADAFLIVGIAGLLIYGWRRQPESGSTEPAPSPPAA